MIYKRIDIEIYGTSMRVTFIDGEGKNSGPSFFETVELSTAGERELRLRDRAGNWRIITLRYVGELRIEAEALS